MIAGAGGLAVGGALVGLSQPKRALLTFPGDEKLPEKSAQPKRVVVIGGGLAGLTAAIELQKRGLQVTLIERAPALGGKLTGWKLDNAAGSPIPMEHGFHGFFAQYHNVHEVLEDAGAIGNLKELSVYDVLFANGTMDRYGRDDSTVFPFNVLGVVTRSANMHMRQFLSGDGLLDLMKFDPDKTFKQFDHYDLLSWAKERGVNAPMVDGVIVPFGKTSLNRPARLSAAEAIRFFHFYFIGNPDGLSYRCAKDDLMTSVVDPLEQRFLKLGGRVKKGVGVERIIGKAGQRVEAVVLTSDRGEAQRALRVSADKVPATGWVGVPREDGSNVFVARRGQDWLALDGRCTHMGCPVNVDATGTGFQCPCHSGRFDGEGNVTGGPPPRALVRLPVVASRDGSSLEIGAPPSDAQDAIAVGEERLDCDYCVVACDVRGLRGIFEKSKLGAPELEKNVASLGEADPYIVWRLWLDRPTQPDRTPFYTATGYVYIDSIAIYPMLENAYAAWAKKTGGTVIELHSYGVAPELVVEHTKIRAVMLDELFRIIPELKGSRILYDVFMMQNNFSRWAPGDDATRPRTQTSIANLFIAGDHTKLDQPAALMEAATMSGRFAANAVLGKEALRRIPIPSVALKGPMA